MENLMKYLVLYNLVGIKYTGIIFLISFGLIVIGAIIYELIKKHK